MPDHSAPPLAREEIDRLLAEIARDRDAGVAQLRALIAAKELQVSGPLLDPPATHEEQVQRLARVMKPMGPEACRIAYSQAFPKNTGPITDVPRLYVDDLNEDDRALAESCRSLKLLYRRFPEIKRPGYPPGYPQGRGPMAQQTWCQRKAAQMLLDRRQASLAAAAKEDFAIQGPHAT